MATGEASGPGGAGLGAGAVARAARREGDGRRRLSGVERAVAVAGFPVAVVATHGWALHRMAGGMDPEVATAVPIPIYYLALAWLERVFPWHRSWLHSRGDLRTDVGLLLTNTAMLALLTPLVLIAATWAGAALADRIGTGLWPTGWPILAQLALGLVVAELVEYSVHRAFHEVPGLWRFHATHHSAPRLYWLNAVRFHPIDLFLVGACKMIPLAVLGAGIEVFGLVNLFSAVHGAYQHANLPVRIGPLNWIFSMTELHRWHHSRHMDEANHNYGGNLAVWDVVFGTRWLPKDREPPEAIGMEDLPDFPMGLVDNLLAPFCWDAVVRRARTGGAAPSAP
jgi:sterol desaturase/sphingolipid hydroxylase (fatty acid hydroxylase superfamily)